MKAKPRGRLSLLIALTLLASAGGTFAQIVSNGGFEVPLVAPGSAIYTNGESFGGWTVEGGHVLLSSACPLEGVQSVFLFSTIYQDLNTIIGAHYRLSYDCTCEFECGGGCDAVGHGVYVGWDTDTGVLDYIDGLATNSRVFVASNVASRLIFTGFKGVKLDHVTVSMVSCPVAIRKVDNTHVTLIWSTNASDFMLEYASALSPLAWSRATNVPETFGRDFVVTFETGSQPQFFRLRKQ